ncbi:MAG: 1-(5-phosphoribosyl)-5-[(5-phosphoribosylamino)methylideneamino]imidazole-4-carboxamide isomerase [Thermoflexales bacterium]|nr:1-(5-phosphoribosyl)-5-[(5-phosphoribosylamino)methylideneamino]imidazole-4-carboxamide isomerase [Thermoflexales bacterium]
MNAFTIYPAIDLRQGKVVRLQQGDPQRSTMYADDALAVAQRWAEAGAAWIHVVNLDGAMGNDEAAAVNRAVLARICREVSVRVQFGGGLRSLDDVRAAFDAGVARVVLGTAVVENPRLVADVIAHYGAERLVVGLDAREGLVVTRGWQQRTPLSVIELGQRMREMGARYALYTEVERDGMMRGPAAELTAALAQLSGLQVIASGGVRHLDDVRELLLYAPRGVCGVVIGRALYEGAIDLKAALHLVAQQTQQPYAG